MQLSVVRSRRRAVEARWRLLRSAGFEAHTRHGIWISDSLRKVISEAVVSSINLAQLGCWIKRPVPPGGWSAWFKTPVSVAALRNIVRVCAPADTYRPATDETALRTDAV